MNDDSDDAPRVDGPGIRFMWDYGVTVPLWADGELLPEEPQWLQAALGLSETLVADLTNWGEAMNRLDGTAKSDVTQAEYAELDTKARCLADQVQAEVGPHYVVTYRPW